MGGGVKIGALFNAFRQDPLQGRSRALLLAFLLVVATVFCFLFLAYRSDAVVGPEGTYTESNGDRIEICESFDASWNCVTPKNTFANGNTVYVRVQTTRATNSTGSGSDLRLRNYLNTQVGTTSTWTQRSAISPYVYTASVAIPSGNTANLKVVGNVVSTAGPRVSFEESIDIPTINQFMHIYSDAGQTDESYTFRPGAVMYIRAYGNGNAYSAGQTGTRNRLYNFTNTSVYSWTAPAVSQAGNWYDFSLTVPATGLTSGDWYWVRGWLRNSGGGTIMRNSRMILIDGISPTAGLTAPPVGAYIRGSVNIDGTADDTISFYDYLVEYGAGAAPVTWNPIGSAVYTPVNNGTLQSWDTTSVTDGLYTLRLTVRDRAYNTAQATRQVNVDNTAPVISGVGANPITSATATVNWTTDEVSDSLVEYDTNPGPPYSYSGSNASMVTSHSLPLGGLQPSTTYYYRVRSTDQAGNFSYSTEYSFKTANLTVLQPFPAIGKDTTIESYQPTWNRGSDIWLVTGNSSHPDWGIARNLLQYDLSQIPVSATILSANMSLYQMWQANNNAITIDTHQVTPNGWVEGSGAGSATGDGATWLTYDGIQPWTSAGGDYSPAPAASATAPDSTASWVNWDITALTQSWLGGTPNYGVVIKANTENPALDDFKTYYSSDYLDDPALRPKLIIEWFGNDSTPPVAGEVRAENVTRTTANIRWSTDENSDSRVEYGTTTSYGSMTPLDSTMVNQHTVPLFGLTEDTVYHYRVRSADPSGNEVVSGDYVFQTAVQIVIQPNPATGADTWIGGGGPTLNHGASTDLLAGNNSSTSDSRRGLLEFDLSQIPSGSTIIAATLSLYQHTQADTSEPQLGVYYATRSWVEGTGDDTATGDGATWLTYDGTSSWAASGGDFNGTVQATTNAPNSTGAWVDFAISGLLQNWTDGTITNNGLFIKKVSEDIALQDYKTFYSSDYATDPSLRPKLVIEYVPAPGTITMTIDETWNRDNTPGSSSVGFGNVTAGLTYFVGDTATPPYAVKLTVKSNALWGLKVSTSGDLESSPPGNTIDISELSWKKDADPPASYLSMVKTPTETVVDSGLPATNGLSYLFDYRLAVPALAVSGNYETSVVYTAYPE